MVDAIVASLEEEVQIKPVSLIARNAVTAVARAVRTAMQRTRSATYAVKLDTLVEYAEIRTRLRRRGQEKQQNLTKSVLERPSTVNPMTML